MEPVELPSFDRASIDTTIQGMWRYRHALPLPEGARQISLGEMTTPLLETALFGRPGYLKVDYQMPTGSYKDRGSTLLVSALAVETDAELVEDSSGNAGASIAAYAARAGMRITIHAPADAGGGKRAQILASGARFVGHEDGRTAAAEAARRQVEQTPAIYASHVWNPLFSEGCATLAWEIAEQLDWRPPPEVWLPVGNGSLLIGVYRGFAALEKSGSISTLPRLQAVQAAACAPLSGGHPVTACRTIAEGIAVPAPPRLEQIRRSVEATGGTVHIVGESDIADMQRTLGERGLFVEPTAAVAPAAALRTGCSSGAVVILTGSGLKTADSFSSLRSDQF